MFTGRLGFWGRWLSNALGTCQSVKVVKRISCTFFCGWPQTQKSERGQREDEPASRPSQRRRREQLLLEWRLASPLSPAGILKTDAAAPDRDAQVQCNGYEVSYDALRLTHARMQRRHRALPARSSRSLMHSRIRRARWPTRQASGVRWLARAGSVAQHTLEVRLTLDSRFAFGQKDDVIECLEQTLEMLHKCYEPTAEATHRAYAALPDTKDRGRIPSATPCFGRDCPATCIVHGVWGLALSDRQECSCTARRQTSLAIFNVPL